MLNLLTVTAVDRAVELLLTYLYAAGPGIGLVLAPLFTAQLVGEYRRYRTYRGTGAKT